MRTTVFLRLLKLLTQRTCIFLNSACYLSTAPWAWLCLEWTLLITSWKKCRDCQREQPCLSSCLEWQAGAIRFPTVLHPSWRGRKKEGLRGLGVERGPGGSWHDAQRWVRLAVSGFQALSAGTGDINQWPQASICWPSDPALGQLPI